MTCLDRLWTAGFEPATPCSQSISTHFAAVLGGSRILLLKPDSGLVSGFRFTADRPVSRCSCVRNVSQHHVSRAGEKIPVLGSGCGLPDHLTYPQPVTRTPQPGMTIT